MRFLRYVLPIAALCGFLNSSAVYGDDYTADEERARSRDFSGVSGFVKSKRQYTLQEKLPHLNISGDLRAKYENISQRSGLNSETGLYSTAQYPRHQFTAEFNLNFDYKADDTWAVLSIGAGSNAGVRGDKSSAATNGLRGSGTDKNLSLGKVLVGYNLLEDGASRLDAEIGRRKLYDLFDSKLQFQSRFDGLALKYSNGYEGIGDFYANVGAFVIDQTSNHFGYVGEAGLLDIADTGIDFKYSMINWQKKGLNRNEERNPVGARFLNSQFKLGYNLPQEMLGAKAQVYGAFLMNHKADAQMTALKTRQNKAWYVGMGLGDVRKENDWSIDVSYQYCEAQAIADSDNGGVTRGEKYIKPAGKDPYTASYYEDKSCGNGNYKGIRLEGLYALTDNWTVRLKLDHSRAAKQREIDAAGPSVANPGKHLYSKVELTSIYAF